jgi:putrescine importer
MPAGDFSPRAQRRFERVLTLKDLIFYGIVLIQPIAPVGIFGIASKMSHGHAATTIVIAMAAMMLTAFSYGRMAAIYPTAGSAYTYVGRGLNAHLGFLAGWAMFLDYLIIPVINTIYIALTIERLFSSVPYIVWAALSAATITLLNLRGIRYAARLSVVLLAIMCVVIGAFLFLAIRYLFHLAGWSGLLSWQPFYHASSFDFHSVAAATSLASLTYIGFDGVTTLAEDVKDPKRTVLVATVLVCLITGILSTVEVYLAQRVWPDYGTFVNLETAFMDVTRRVGGTFLFDAMGIILLLACLGSGLAGQVGAARLLFGMGRDNVLPSRMFAYLDSRNNPSNNIWLVGLLAFAGAVVLSYERAAELLNFGAFLAFMGVNLATIRKYYYQALPLRKRRLLVDACLPALGFLFCLGIWLSLPWPAKVAGGAWLLLGVVFDAVKTRGFRTTPAVIDFGDS